MHHMGWIYKFMHSIGGQMQFHCMSHTLYLCACDNKISLCLCLWGLHSNSSRLLKQTHGVDIELSWALSVIQHPCLNNLAWVHLGYGQSTATQAQTCTSYVQNFSHKPLVVSNDLLDITSSNSTAKYDNPARRKNAHAQCQRVRGVVGSRLYLPIS